MNQRMDRAWADLEARDRIVRHIESLAIQAVKDSKPGVCRTMLNEIGRLYHEYPSAFGLLGIFLVGAVILYFTR